jgi:hypothetical protein
MRSSTLTGTAAVLFGGAIVALIAAIVRNADTHGGALMCIALALLAATVVCWFAAARMHST